MHRRQLGPNQRVVSRHMTEKGADRAAGACEIDAYRKAGTPGRSSGYAHLRYDVRRRGLVYRVIET
jgi:hypothetical protein